jgi:membrane-associated phospholipid phosphatase
MVTNREGVVGMWDKLKSCPPNYDTRPSALDLWSTPVRLRILQAEMLSGIYYDDGGDQSVAVQYWQRHEGREQTLVHMIRPCDEDFVAQLCWVNNYAALRMERSGEIMAELTNILSFLGSVGFLHPDRTRRTFELLTLVQKVTVLIEMRIKHALACRRPTEYSPQIQPMIPTPGHGSLPSGHATESFAAAFVFYALLTEVGIAEKEQTFIQLMRIAERIAINRTVAGVHFPVDSVAGMVLGRTLAEFFIARFGGRGDPRMRTFDGRCFSGDFCYEKVLAMSYAKDKDRCKIEAGDSGQNIMEGAALDIKASDQLSYLWKQALAECRLMINPRPETLR